MVTGVVGLIFLLNPDLKPDASPVRRSVTLSNLRIDPAPYSVYLDRVELAGVKKSDFKPSDLKQRGVLATYDVRIIGREGELLPLEHKLVDEATGETLVEDKSEFLEPDTRDASWTRHVWLPLPKENTTAFFNVELRVRDGNAYIPLRSLDSDPFSTERARSE